MMKDALHGIRNNVDVVSSCMYIMPLTNHQRCSLMGTTPSSIWVKSIPCSIYHLWSIPGRLRDKYSLNYIILFNPWSTPMDSTICGSKLTCQNANWQIRLERLYILNVCNVFLFHNECNVFLLSCNVHTSYLRCQCMICLDMYWSEW